MKVLVENHQHLLSININSIAPICKSVLSVESLSCDEINVYFVDEKTICDLHKQHFNDPSPTDCISIQVDSPSESPCFLGEIYISPKAALDYAKAHNRSSYEELTLYLVHGLLHLLGYDDIEESDEKKMRLAEKKHLNYLLSNKLLIKE